MPFSLGQSSDCFAILRNLFERHYPFPDWRPADAKIKSATKYLCQSSMYQMI